MAYLRPGDTESEDERYGNQSSSHSAYNGFEGDGDDEFDSGSILSATAVPVHPIPTLQQPFEESIVEAADDTQYETTPRSATHPSAESRRRDLLDRDTYDDSWRSRWAQKPSAEWHPLTKLIAQIIFGMHLLYNYQAKSDAEVVKILQAHVDDIDGFVEKSTEDFDLAIEDIQERLNFLRLPMTHLDVFNVMLEDNAFRTQLVNGNEKIEIIIQRTAKAMNAALADVERGIGAIEELAKYLDKVKDDWPEDYAELPAIYAAMRSNQEGWLDCLRALQMKGNTLGVILVQLGAVIGEINGLAAATSRRIMLQRLNSIAAPRSKYASRGPKSDQPRQSRTMSQYSLDKPLPQEPDVLRPAVQATLPNQRHHQQIFHSRQHSKQSAAPTRTVEDLTRKHTKLKMEPREPQNMERAETRTLATFIRYSGPPESRPIRRSVSEKVSSRPPAIMNDSAYSSGSDPAAERRIQKRSNNPANFGLFPDSKPATPESFSRPSSIRAITPAPPDRPAPTKLKLVAKTSHFSLRKIFHRRSRVQEMI